MLVTHHCSLNYLITIISPIIILDSNLFLYTIYISYDLTVLLKPGGVLKQKKKSGRADEECLLHRALHGASLHSKMNHKIPLTYLLVHFFAKIAQSYRLVFLKSCELLTNGFIQAIPDRQDCFPDALTRAKA